MSSLCTTCERSGRSWALLDQDIYCGLCGCAVRDVDLFVANEDQIAQPLEALARERKARAAGVARLWFVAPDADGVGHTALHVVNTGSSPVTVTQIDADAPECQVIVPAESILPERSLRAYMTLAGPPQSYPREIELKIEGNFPSKVMTLGIAHTPVAFTARPPEGDEWSRRAAQDLNGGAPARGVLKVDPQGRGLRWELSELVLMPWAMGETRFEVLPDREGWAGRELPSVDPSGVRWEGGADASGAPLQIKVKFQSRGKGLPLCFSIEASGLDGPVAGEVVFEFEALGRPEVRIPVRLVPGRPEWSCRMNGLDGQSLILPCGYPSVLYVTFTAALQHETSPLAALISDYSIEVGAAPHDPAPTWRVQRIGPQLQPGTSPRQLKFKIVLTPPRCSFDLEVQLVARIGAGTAGPRGGPAAGAREASLSTVKRLRVEALEANDKRLVSEHRLVVDFGTTNTCVGRADAGVPLDDTKCLPLGELAGDQSQTDKADLIPTVLWIRGTDSQYAPQCVAGRVAETQDLVPGATVFDLFKPELCNPRREYFVPYGEGLQKQWKYTAGDLAMFYLREILLEARAELGYHLVQAFYVTCPSTFTAEQRRELEGVMERLKPAGIVGEAALLLDEANAGAFRDLYLHLPKVMPRPKSLHAMIFDFGGGTIDVAILRAAKRSDEPMIYDLEPLGVTGLRDFGGKNVTDAIARELGRRLATQLYTRIQEKTSKPLMTLGVPPWIPLPPSIIPALANFPSAVLDVARTNEGFLSAVAEEIKTRVYGSFGKLSVVSNNGELRLPAGDWYKELDENLISAVLAQPIPEASMRLEEITQARPGGEVVTRSVRWGDYLKNCTLTRADLDEMLKPALEEVFGRAMRMWKEVHDTGGKYEPPDLFLLAGGSSQLPLIWKMACAPASEGGLGMPRENIRFVPAAAKRKVALGAALYALVRYRIQKLAIQPPEDALKFLLVPIVSEVGYDQFIRMFPLDYRVTETGVPEVRRYLHPESLMELVVYENVDWRYEGWQPDKKLKELGMYAPGKQHLATFAIRFRDVAQTTVTHLLYRTGLTRKMAVRFDGPASPMEKPI